MDPMLRKAPRRWTAEEDALLYREAMKQSPNSVWDWNRIAACFTDRSNKDCRKRWVNHVSGGLKKGPWAEAEDAKLREAVQGLGQRWTLVADAVGCRSADQCAKRWQHHLDPQLDRREWTKDEDDQLLRAVQKYGRSWKSIRDQRFPARSRNDVKNRHTILSRRRQSTSSTTSKRNMRESPRNHNEDKGRTMHEHDDEDDDEDDEEDDDDEDENEADGDMNHNLNDNDDILKVSYTSGTSGQDTTNLDPYISAFPPFGLNTGAMDMPPVDHTFPLPVTMSDPMVLDPVQAELNYTFDPTSNELDLLATTSLDSTVSTMPWSFAPDIAPTCTATATDDTISLPRTSLEQQGNSTPTYKRVTLVLEDYERGLMDQLLQIVSTSQGKSQIEILP